MLQEMAGSNKGAAPDMGDLSDVSALLLFSGLLKTILQQYLIF